MFKAVQRFVVTGLVLSCLHAAPALGQDSPGKIRGTVERVEPSYPALARRNGLVGAVKLRVQVAPDGRPTDVVVMGGNPVFVQGAVDSVKKWKWSKSDQQTTEVIELRFDK
jgi:TonB family protein